VKAAPKIKKDDDKKDPQPEPAKPLGAGKEEK